MPRISKKPYEEQPFQAFDGQDPPDAGDAAFDGLVVDTSDQEQGAGLPTDFEMKNDGQVEAANDTGASDDAGDHHANLAGQLEDGYLTKLGQDIVEMVDRDIQERGPWRDRFERGLEMMGLVESEVDDGPFPGAASAVPPLLLEAITQFWGRAMGELFPADGPVKSKVMGQQTQEALARAERVSEYMNYEVTIEDKPYIDESSRLVWALGFHGNAFRKTYRDVVNSRNVGVYVSADDLIVPSEATNLQTAARYTHRMKKSRNDLKRLMHAKMYLKIDLEATLPEEGESVQMSISESEDSSPDNDEADNEHTIYETMIDLEIPGHEHAGDDGEETGIELPYVVTVEKDSAQVLAIRRAWDQNDPMVRRIINVTKYGFVPGFGFYDLGLLHLVGGLQKGATGALRVLLDSAAAASLSGGFMAKNANLKGKTFIFTPGHWEPVDCTSEDLQKAFFAPPVKEPAPALFQLLGFLMDQGRSMAATTEIQTGGTDGKNIAVGTVSQLIEQGEKVMGTVHRMMHRSLGEELRQRFQLCKEYAPTDGYPYDVAGEERTVYADDFAKGITIVPVSDPNIFSSSQRLALSQMAYDISMQNPDVVPKHKTIRRLFEAARIPDIDDLVQAQPDPQPYDPNGEIQAILMGKPVLVVPEQPHVEHLRVLSSFITNPEYGGNEQVQKLAGPSIASVIAQHMAYAWVTHSRGLGAPSGYMDPNSGQVQQPEAPPEMIAQALAQIAPQLAMVPGLPSTGGDGKNQETERMKVEAQMQGEQAKLQMKREEHQDKMQMEREKHELKLQVEQEKAAAQKQKIEADEQAAMQKAHMDTQVQQAEAQARMQSAEQQAQIDQQMGQQKMSMEQDQMAQQGQMKQQQAEQDMALKSQKANLDQLRSPNGGPSAMGSA